jgi:hypothetical protein
LPEQLLGLVQGKVLLSQQYLDTGGWCMARIGR